MKQLTKENLRLITNSSGIYYIKGYEYNYVGSSRSLKKRLLEHLNTLKKVSMIILECKTYLINTVLKIFIFQY